MSKSKVEKRVFPQITAITFNPDGTKVALCAGTPEIYIYTMNGSKKENAWEIEHTLKEVSLISSLASHGGLLPGMERFFQQDCIGVHRSSRVRVGVGRRIRKVGARICELG